MRSVQTFIDEIDDGNRVIERLVVELFENGDRVSTIIPKSQDWADWFCEGWMNGLLSYAADGTRLFAGKPIE